jgi:hypothetical protein
MSHEVGLGIDAIYQLFLVQHLRLGWEICIPVLVKVIKPVQGQQ